MPHSTRVAVPVLRIVPTDKIVPHELYDSQRAEPLIRRLPEDGTLKNPPVVAELAEPDDRLVILDGTNRVIAFQRLGYPHCLVQIVKYDSPQVVISPWNHVVSLISSDIIHQRLRAIDGLTIEETDSFHARAALARRSILAYVTLADGLTLALSGGGMDLKQRTRLLQNVAAQYTTSGQLNRSNLWELDELKSIYPQISAVVVFPAYQAVEIMELAQIGFPVPSGVTRHVIHGRALRINYPLSLLTSDHSLEEKNATLASWVQDQFREKAVRYYEEATYLFDE